MRISDWSSDVCSSDLSERCLRNLRNILAIDQNAPGLHIIEAEEQARDGRLACARRPHDGKRLRSEEHTSELQSLMRISYAVFCLKKKNHKHEALIQRTN